ncbi:hypothetical protein ACVR0P_05945 [Streptococcus castoreus]|uniref:hypothetical protein n=1 Tax=Streptococcus castoreus TaxID=254786 RepID=UPI00041EB2F0|nr:hypothetical protein [Streptococcus castoreus]
MAYTLEEQETFVRFDALDKQWTIETNYSPHIQKVLKLPEAYEVLNAEEEGRMIWLNAIMKIGEDFSINVFPKKKRKMTEEQCQELAERMKQARTSLEK